MILKFFEYNKILNDFPIKKLNTVYHIGTMDISKKSTHSYEGSGLSISTMPDVWRRISETTYGDTIKLTKNNGIFLDYYKLLKNKDLIKNITEWGIDNNYVFEVPIYRVLINGLGYMEFFTYDEAIKEADNLKKIKIKKGLKNTEKLRKETMQNKIDPLSIFDFLVTVYIENTTNFDGVWWNDKIDYDSAPRGVIFNKKINEWDKKIL